MKIFFLLIFALIINIAAAQDRRKEIVDSLINTNSLTVKKDIRYNQSGHPILLDIYYPTNYHNEKLPCIVWIHGGGLTDPNRLKDCDLIRWGTAVSAINGFIAVSINYRLITEAPLPAAIEDCSTAIRFLKANAGKYGIDDKRIGVVGESSGGFLSAFITFAGDTKTFTTKDWKGFSNHVDCGVVWYGYSEQTKYDVRDFISKNDPPSLFIHGEYDKNVPIQEAYNMKNACQDKGLSTSLTVIKNAVHGFADIDGKFDTRKKHMEQVLDLTIGFFKQHLLK